MYCTLGKLNSSAPLTEMFFCSAMDDWQVVVPNLSDISSLFASFVPLCCLFLFVGKLLAKQKVLEVNLHTEVFFCVPSRATHHTTTHNTTRRQTERHRDRQRKKTETERDRERQRKTDKTRKEKRRRDKKREETRR